MSEQWALKYRPVRWFDFAGQRPAIWTLYQTILRDDPPPAILLYGEAGCGKTSTARTIAKSLNCESEVRTAREWPCGKCSSCLAIASGSSVDVEEIDAASNGSVATIRELRQRAGQYTTSRYKVFILDEAHQLSPEAFDTLLKTLEEPLEGVVFVLVTTRLRKIPRTIQTRCGKFRFDPLSAPVIRQRLEYIAAAEGFSPGPGLLSAIAEVAEGGMRDAIMAMDLAASAGITSVTMWRELTGVTDFAPVLLAAAASADYGALFAALDEAVAGDPGRVTSQLIRCMTDMLVLTVPGGEISRDGEVAESRRVLAARLGPGRILAGLQVLWEMPKLATGNPRADLSLACSMISRRWAPRPHPLVRSLRAKAARTPCPGCAECLEPPVTSPELSDRHPATQHLMGILRPNPNLDGIAADVSVALFQAACDQVTILRDGPELSAGLRLLWEAKNCLVMQGLIDSGAVSA